MSIKAATLDNGLLYHNYFAVGTRTDIATTVGGMPSGLETSASAERERNERESAVRLSRHTTDGVKTINTFDSL